MKTTLQGVSIFVLRHRSDFDRYDVASGSEDSNVEKKVKRAWKQKGFGKDKIFLLSDISHFSTKHARGNKSVSLEPLATSSEPSSSLVSRHLFGLFSYFKQQKMFLKFFTNANILFRNEGLVTFHFLQKIFYFICALIDKPV